MSLQTISELERRADRAERDGLLDYALILWQELTERAPTVHRHWLKLAHLAARLDRRPVAQTALTQALQHAADLEGRFEVCDLALDLRDYAIATELLRDARARFGDGGGIRRRLVEAFLMTRRIDEARWEIRRALRLSPSTPFLVRLLERCGEFAQFGDDDGSSYAKREYHVLYRGVVLGGPTDDGLWVPRPDRVFLDHKPIAVIVQRLIAHLYARGSFPKHVVPRSWVSIPLALAISTIANIPVSINAQGHDRQCLYVFGTFPDDSPPLELGEEDRSFALCFNGSFGLGTDEIDPPHFIGYNTTGNLAWTEQPIETTPDVRSRQMTDISLRIIQTFKALPLDAELAGPIAWMITRQKRARLQSV
ncbi:MAG: tetratricopeptide repeat protein [Myxococcales bacterium]|nr:tetratricopeptide repeat protein [Myxococcales bacterium]